MTNADDPLPIERSTVWSGGPCPECGDRGALLVLRRRPDGALLFHCPVCGLAFLHECGEEGEPDAGLSLAVLAPDGIEAASPDEIRAAGLTPHVNPAYEGGLENLLAHRTSGASARPRPRHIPWVPTEPKEVDPRLVSIFLGLLGGVFAMLLLEAWRYLSRLR